MSSNLESNSPIHFQCLLIKTFMIYVVEIFDPTILAMAYDQRSKFVRAEYFAMAEAESCAFGPKLCIWE